MDIPKCRACEYTNEIHRAAVEAEVERLSKMKGLRLCGEDELKKRLLLCSECGQLDMNGVCMMCGCYARIRTLPADSRCPAPQRRW